MAPVATVVVVEDDPATRTALGRLLRASDFEPLTFCSAEQYLASTPGEPPLCFVFDIHLGGMSGLELQHHLKAGGSTVPVIIMTAFNEPCLKEEASRNGCLAFLSKESDSDVLLDLLRSL
jgi:FixJ family two-component response regulator